MKILQNIGSTGPRGRSDYETWLLIPGNENRSIQEYFDSRITSFPSYDIEQSIDLFDNTEETFTIAIEEISILKNYVLFFNSQEQGLSAKLSSWNDGNVFITVSNNTGQKINLNLNFKLIEI